MKTSLALVIYYGLSSIKRWHNRKVLSEETVDSHSAKVGVIAVLLAVMYLRKKPEIKIDLFRILWFAQFHDVDELYTGDVPGYIKKRHPSLAESLKVIASQSEEKILGELPEVLQVHNKMTTLEKRLVKLADKVSGYYFSLNETSLGNGVEFDPIVREYEEILASFDDLQWLVDDFFAAYGKDMNVSLSVFFSDLQDGGDYT